MSRLPALSAVRPEWGLLLAPLALSPALVVALVQCEFQLYRLGVPSPLGNRLPVDLFLGLMAGTLAAVVVRVGLAIFRRRYRGAWEWVFWVGFVAVVVMFTMDPRHALDWFFD